MFSNFMKALESLNYSRYVEATASDPARDTHRQQAIYSESRNKRGDGTLNSSSCTKAVNKLTGVVVHTEGPDLSGKHMTCRLLY